jgi:hypothetical protein
MKWQRVAPVSLYVHNFLTETEAYVRSEALTAVTTKMVVFWVVVPCILVEGYLCFKGPCCLYLQGAAIQKTAIF